MGWLFGRGKKEAPPPPPAVLRIREDVVDLICEAARATHPHEFGGVLRAGKGGLITDLMLLPGTVSGATHAIFQLHMLPIDFQVRGTVHSHPGGVPRPSGADLELFRRFGSRHIIIGSPYDRTSWLAYDGLGNLIRAEVVRE